jgi:hypothetical protein
MRWKLICGVLLVAAAATYGYEKMTSGWETLSTSFTKGDKPYGAGQFVVRGDQAISLKISGPEITFKPAGEAANPDVAEPSEAWMSDSNQRMNRWTVNFMRGSINGAMSRTFSQVGQSGAWWHSPDWNSLYVSTGWMDYTLPIPADGLSPQTTKLWRSQDGGQHWTQLDWPHDLNIGRLLFLDPLRGYAIGWGPRVWRTGDGGQTWREIPRPAGADQGQARATFDSVDLAQDGVLRVAYYVGERGEVRRASVIDQLRWDQQAFEPDVVLSNQTVTDLRSAPDAADHYAVYALTRDGAPDEQGRSDVKGALRSHLVSWLSQQPKTVRQLHTFETRFSLDSLDVGVRDVLVVNASESKGDGPPRDYTLYSTNAGKSWSVSNDGMLQGGSFDPKTNTQYALSAYTLKKRTF